MDGCHLMSDEADFDDETGQLSEDGRREFAAVVSAVLDVISEADVVLSGGGRVLGAETLSRDAFLEVVHGNAIRNGTRYRVRVSPGTARERGA